MGETIKVTALECPNCGAGISKGSRQCARCYSDYIVTINRFDESGIKAYLDKCKVAVGSGTVDGNSVEVHTAMGICQLRRKLYKYANADFEKAIALLPEDADVYYYAAIALLEGKRPFLSPLPVIRRAVEYIDLALELTETGAYYYLKHLIHKDFYEMKNLRCCPTSAELLKAAKHIGIEDNEMLEIHSFLALQ